MSTSPARVVAVPVALAAAGLLWAGSALTAAAHVGVSATSTEAGASSVLTFAFSHGCAGSPTTGLVLQVPEGVNAVSPQLKPGWQIEKVMTDLEQPLTDSHGNEVTERVAEVRLSADAPVPDGYRETVELQLTLPEDAAGSTLAFPVVQTCTEGENAWVQVAAEGQDPHDLESPAPVVEVTPAGAEDGHGTDGASTGPGPGPDGQAAATTGGDGPDLGVIGLVAGLAGLAAGLTALVRSAKRGA